MPVFTQILTTVRNFHPTANPGVDSHIIVANNAHQEKINSYTKAMDPSIIMKISTTPCLTERAYCITTLITHKA